MGGQRGARAVILIFEYVTIKEKGFGRPTESSVGISNVVAPQVHMFDITSVKRNYYY